MGRLFRIVFSINVKKMNELIITQEEIEYCFLLNLFILHST